MHAHLSIPPVSHIVRYALLWSDGSLVPMSAVRNYVLATRRTIKSVHWETYFRSYGGPLDEESSVFVYEMQRLGVRLYVRTKLVNAKIAFKPLHASLSSSSPNPKLFSSAGWMKYIETPRPTPPKAKNFPALLHDIVGSSGGGEWIQRHNLDRVRQKRWRESPGALSARNEWRHCTSTATTLVSPSSGGCHDRDVGTADDPVVVQLTVNVDQRQVTLTASGSESETKVGDAHHNSSSSSDNGLENHSVQELECRMRDGACELLRLGSLLVRLSKCTPT